MGDFRWRWWRWERILGGTSRTKERALCDRLFLDEVLEPL
jgi:hypothetical protein